MNRELFHLPNLNCDRVRWNRTRENFPILEFEGIDIYHTKSMTSGVGESVSYFQSRRR